MRQTYAQVKSEASAFVKKGLEKGRLLYTIIYKNSGGDYKMHELHDGAVICYTSFKAIVYADGVTNEVRIACSREKIASILEQFKNTKFIYTQFG